MAKQELNLEQVAKKFVELPKELTSLDKILEAGYMTREEFESVKDMPRSTEMESGTKWAKIKSGDKERTLYPFYSLLTETEKQIYRGYKKNHMPTMSSGSPKAEELNKELDELKAELVALKVPAEILAKLEKFRIAKKNSLIADMFGVDTIQALAGKVNLAYVMFRGPKDEFADDLQPNIVDLVQKGFMPKYTLQQVKDNVTKLESKGILVKGCIVDLA